VQHLHSILGNFKKPYSILGNFKQLHFNLGNIPVLHLNLHKIRSSLADSNSRNHISVIETTG